MLFKKIKINIPSFRKVLKNLKSAENKVAFRN